MFRTFLGKIGFRNRINEVDSGLIVWTAIVIMPPAVKGHYKLSPVYLSVACLDITREQKHRRIQGAIRPCPYPVCQWNLAPSRQRFSPHKNGTHPSFCLFCLLSTSFNFRTHNNFNSIHITDLVYTCIVTSSDSSLAPSLSMTYCTPSDHLLLFHSII